MTTAYDVPATARPIPGPRGNFLLGTLLQAWEDPLGMMSRGVRDHGEIVGFRFAHLRYVVVADPEGIKHVLVTNHKNYTKSRNYAGLKVVLGEGLLTAEGEKWRKHLRVLHFVQQNFRSYHLKYSGKNPEVAASFPEGSGCRSRRMCSQESPRNWYLQKRHKWPPLLFRSQTH